MDLKLEVVVVPVSDVDTAKHFYETALGYRLDADVSGEGGFRVVHDPTRIPVLDHLR